MMKKIIYFLFSIIFILSVSCCAKVNTIDYDIITQDVDIDTDIKTLKKKYDNLILYKEELEKELALLRTNYDTINDEISNIQYKIDNIDDILANTYYMFGHLENEIIKSAVYIRYFIKLQSNTYSAGSGFIVAEKNDYYYLLTNNHVVYDKDETSSYYVEVFDYLNNIYSSKKGEAEVLYRSRDYDMALLRISNKYSISLNVMDIASNNPTKDDMVFAIGNPLNQRNSIACGNVLGYTYTSLKTESSEIKYELVIHNAFELEGSSGGMLINKNYDVVAINTIGSSSNSYDYTYCLSSPASQIRNFIIESGYEEVIL